MQAHHCLLCSKFILALIHTLQATYCKQPRSLHDRYANTLNCNYAYVVYNS